MACAKQQLGRNLYRILCEIFSSIRIMFTVKQALSQLMWGSVISGGDGLWQEAIEFKIKVDT